MYIFLYVVTSCDTRSNMYAGHVIKLKVCVCVCVCWVVCNPMSRGCEKYYVIYDSRTYNIKTTIVPIHGDHIISSMRIEAILSR